MLLSYFAAFRRSHGPTFLPLPTGLRDATSHLVKTAKSARRMQASTQRGGAPIGLPHALDSTLRCFCCSLGRSAAQASCSRNLSKLDVCQGAAAHTPHHLSSGVGRCMAWQQILASQHLEAVLGHRRTTGARICVRNPEIVSPRHGWQMSYISSMLYKSPFA